MHSHGLRYGSQTTPPDLHAAVLHATVEFNSLYRHHVPYAMIWHMGSFPTINCESDMQPHCFLKSAILCTMLPPSLTSDLVERVCMAAWSANTDDGAHLVDIYIYKRLLERVTGCIFWHEGVLIDFPNASTMHHSTDTSSGYRKREQVKKQALEYGQHVREIEHGVFTFLVLSTTGGMGREAMDNLLQTPGRHDIPTPLPSSDGLAKMLTLICLTQIIHHVHSSQQILPPQPCLWSDITQGLQHLSVRGGCPLSNS